MLSTTEMRFTEAPSRDMRNTLPSRSWAVADVAASKGSKATSKADVLGDSTQEAGGGCGGALSGVETEHILSQTSRDALMRAPGIPFGLALDELSSQPGGQTRRGRAGGRQPVLSAAGAGLPGIYSGRPLRPPLLARVVVVYDKAEADDPFLEPAG